MFELRWPMMIDWSRSLMGEGDPQAGEADGRG